MYHLEISSKSAKTTTNQVDVPSPRKNQLSTIRYIGPQIKVALVKQNVSKMKKENGES